jgi:carbon storage regulator
VVDAQQQALLFDQCSARGVWFLGHFHTTATLKAEAIMLVLSRKESEQIHIGDDIVVTVIKTGRHKVTIGVDAPRAIRVWRDEIIEAAASLWQPVKTKRGQVTPMHESTTRTGAETCHNKLES